MFPTKLYDGPYTVFRNNGTVFVFETKARLVKAIGWRWLSRCLDEVGPASPQAWLKVRVVHDAASVSRAVFIDHGLRYLVLNDLGVALTLADFAEFAAPLPDRSFGNFGIRHSGRRRRLRSSGFRHPRTTAEIRMNAMTVDVDGEVPARARRTAPNVPTAYDDVYKMNQRSWKKHRRTQWR